MNTKTYLFVAAWIKPLKALPVEQRWNVLEAITEYATTGQMTMQLDLMETIAFRFIRNEIDRMKNYRKEMRERRAEAANRRPEKENNHVSTQHEEILADQVDHIDDADHTNDTKDAKAYKEKQEDAPYDIISESESVSKSESVKKSSSTSTRVCICVKAGAP